MLDKYQKCSRYTDFEETTKVKGSIFCHANLILAGAETIEGAVKLAEMAVSA